MYETQKLKWEFFWNFLQQLQLHHRQRTFGPLRLGKSKILGVSTNVWEDSIEEISSLMVNVRTYAEPTDIVAELTVKAIFVIWEMSLNSCFHGKRDIIASVHLDQVATESSRSGSLAWTSYYYCQSRIHIAINFQKFLPRLLSWHLIDGCPTANFGLAWNTWYMYMYIYRLYMSDMINMYRMHRSYMHWQRSHSNL